MDLVLFAWQRVSKLLFLDSAHGALAGASAAGDAGISVDDVDAVALRDGAHGALTCAGAAGDASIGNLVSHELFLLNLGCLYCNTVRGKIKSKILEKV